MTVVAAAQAGDNSGRSGRMGTDIAKSASQGSLSAKSTIRKSDKPTHPPDTEVEGAARAHNDAATNGKGDKSVYAFGPDGADGDATMKQLLGGKGANLAEMCRIGLRVPPGMTISTATCKVFHEEGGKLPEAVWQEVLSGLEAMEKHMEREVGDPKNPLLLSVRSGAAVSMPGMMDTILNLGLNDECVEGLAAKAGERFAWDSYRRLLDMFGSVALAMDHDLFEAELSAVKAAAGVKLDTELDAAGLKRVVQRYKGVYEQEGQTFPSDPYEQLRQSIDAVFRSWESKRAVVYRQVNQIRGLIGTAVNVQAMVFGNLGDTSGTGVCFTRNPATGEAVLYGEYLVNAQGEDVVAGIRTPGAIADMERDLPEAFRGLVKNCETLERNFKDMQDIEFTVEEGQLWMLQCRNGKRTGHAAIAVATALVDEGLVSKARAISKLVEPRHLAQLLHPQFEAPEAYKKDVIGTGMPASPGAAVGQVVFDSKTAEELASHGTPVVLLRKETSPEDVKGMHRAQGVLTQLGGMTSHAAVVARGWGKPCITGCAALKFDQKAGTVKLGGHTLREGDVISLNGATGEIILGAAAVQPPQLRGDAERFMRWVDEHRSMHVYANADTPEDAAQARRNGAEGIGLVRTEHMFFASEDRIEAVRRMIFAHSHEERAKTLEPIEAFQTEDFQGIFAAMGGLPVTVRLLDPPLHEFLPPHDAQDAVKRLAEDVAMSVEELQEAIAAMREVNPMLGFRGCRLGIAYPEVSRAQVRAIISAACKAQAEGHKVQPDIMIPLVGCPKELANQIAIVRATAKDTMAASGETVAYRVGTMIETPRAALLAEQLAEQAEFFSFGTNDLTQMTYGLSRDDIGRFLPIYLEEKIYPHDPFQVLDDEGVGFLIKHATDEGRKARPDIKIGLCGEQGGEPASVEYLHSVGLDYVSCSPYRVPIARLAAAQAQIHKDGSDK